MQKTELCIFCGARPNFIKVAPIIRVINKLAEENSPHKVTYSLVYAGLADDPTQMNCLITSQLGVLMPILEWSVRT